MKGKSGKPRSGTTGAILWRASAAVLALWLLAMAGLTLLAADQIVNDCKSVAAWLSEDEFLVEDVNTAADVESRLIDYPYCENLRKRCCFGLVLDLPLLDGSDYYSEEMENPADYRQDRIYYFDLEGNSRLGEPGYGDLLRDQNAPVTLNGVPYESAEALAQAYLQESDPFCQQVSILETVLVSRRFTYSMEGNNGYCVVVNACHPLKAAIRTLWPVYVRSFLLMALLLTILWLRLRRSFTVPVKRIIRCIADGFTPLPRRPISRWREVSALERNYPSAQKAINQRRQDIQQLQTQLDYTQNAHEKQGKLMADLSWELEKPLYEIRDCVQALDRGETGGHLETILQITGHMDTKVLQMLELSRLESGKVRLVPEQLELTELVTCALEDLTLLLEQKQLRIGYGSVEKVMVMADKSRLQQAIHNLLMYVIDQADQGGEIQIQTYNFREKRIFSVECPGLDLKAEVLEHIWDGASTRESYGWNGLGMAVAKSIIELHQGSCKAFKTLNGGTFTVTLPCVQEVRHESK